jgi:hypothetical protein
MLIFAQYLRSQTRTWWASQQWKNLEVFFSFFNCLGGCKPSPWAPTYHLIRNKPRSSHLIFCFWVYLRTNWFLDTDVKWFDPVRFRLLTVFTPDLFLILSSGDIQASIRCRWPLRKLHSLMFSPLLNFVLHFRESYYPAGFSWTIVSLF